MEVFYRVLNGYLESGGIGSERKGYCGGSFYEVFVGE
jgi:hypothetical protein